MSKETRRELRTRLSKAGNNLALAGLIWLVATFIFAPIVPALGLGRPAGIALSLVMLVSVSIFYVRFLVVIPKLARSASSFLYPDPEGRDEKKVRAMRYTLYFAVSLLTLVIYSSILIPIHSALYGVLFVGAFFVIVYSLVVVVSAYSREVIDWLKKIAKKKPS